MKASDFLGTSMSHDADQMFDLASSLTSIFSNRTVTDTISLEGSEDTVHSPLSICTGVQTMSGRQLYSVSVDSNISNVASLTG